MSVNGGHDLSVPERPQAILLLHGFSNTAGCWRRLRAAGLDARFEVSAPDIRGHGRAAAARPVALGPVLDDIDVLLERPSVLLGYSQGGRIALHAALDPVIAPRLTRLVLIGASPGLANPVERAARREADMRLADAVAQMTIAELAERWAETPVLAGLAPELAAEARADRLKNTPAGLAAALRGLGTGALEPLWGRLGELALPVTLIAGERDAKFSAIAHEMAEQMPDARVVIVPGAGHQVHLEQPEGVAALL